MNPSSKFKKKMKKTTRKKQKKKIKEPEATENTNSEKTQQVSAASQTFATFLAGKEMFAIDLDSIIEILHTFDIVSVPHLPETYTGVVDIRGESVPVIDLRRLLKEEEVETTTRTCLITLINSSKIGFLVDSDVEILTSEQGSFHLLPDCYTEEEAKFIEKIFWIDDKFIGVLRPEKTIEVLAQGREDNEKI